MVSTTPAPASAPDVSGSDQRRGQRSAAGAGTATVAVADQDPWDTPPQRGAGSVFVQQRPLGNASPRAQNADRAPPGSAMRSAVPVTRQAAGAPSAWSQPPQSTHERPRRWCDAGSLGRQSVTAVQKAGAEDRARNSVRNQEQGQLRVSASTSGFSGRQQRPATDAPSWTRCSWSPPGRSRRGE